MKGSDNVRPVIIKRKRVVAGDGHHGGAWKVAYADFVTAMMAFFLMLWLLGSVEEEKRKGVADYFSATFAIQSNSAGSDGVLGGESLSVIESITDSIATRERYRADLELLEMVVEALESQIAADEILGEAFEHVAIRMTDEGLLIELFDLDDRPLFEAETHQPRPVLRLLTDVITDAFLTVSNPVAITAHARSFPAVFLENPVWTMTIGRAEAMKQLMEAAGLPELRVHRVTGNADRMPSVSPATAARNNRLELILLLRKEKL
ncbi:MAG: chemotaxis protein MotB [Natronohydrobacter sp.]|nr:chemotaxis protein MotB [Natronohydrobacter sp.]